MPFQAGIYMRDIQIMNKSEEYTQYRRNRIAVMKKVIIALLLFLILLPTVLCVILFIKINSLQKQLDMVWEHHLSSADALDQAAEGKENQANGMDGALYNENVDTQELKDKSDIKIIHTSVGKDEDLYPGQRVYLTFDDGPSDNTDAILDKLAEYNVKATFFVVMNTDEESIQRYKRIVNEGHTLGMHSATHVYSQIYSSMESYISDVQTLKNYIMEITGVNPIFYRFPGGSSNTVSDISMNDCVDYLDKEDIVYFDWNVASGDADSNHVPAAAIAANVISGIETKSDSVVLMHDSRTKETTVQALDEILRYMADTGINVLPITEGTTPVHHRISK